MIDKYLNYLYEDEVDTGMGGLARIKIKKLKRKEIKEALIGDEDKVERRVDVASGVIVKRDDDNTQLALIIQRAADDHWPNVWEFPRGKCDKPMGESILKCAAREIKEETGLDIVPEKLIDRYEYIADHGKRKSICHVFICSMNDPSQEPKQERPS